jgi:predicted transposase YdaD
VIRDALLVYLDRRVLPEVVSLVLHPKGNLEVPATESLQSPLRMTSLQVKWGVIELWKLAAQDLLAANEIGLLPWVPLASSADPPEVILKECRERIDRQASEEEGANLLAVTQVLARLRYNAPEIHAIFGGEQAMIESPLIQEITERTEVRAKQDGIVRFLAARFKVVPEDISSRLRAVTDLDRLNTLIDLAAQCSNLDSFRSGLV